MRMSNQPTARGASLQRQERHHIGKFIKLLPIIHAVKHKEFLYDYEVPKTLDRMLVGNQRQWLVIALSQKEQVGRQEHWQ